MTPRHAHSDVFQAIAHPARRAILDRLRRGEQPVLAIAEPFAIRLNPEPLREVRDWMKFYDKFWTRKIRGLGEYLDKHKD